MLSPFRKGLIPFGVPLIVLTLLAGSAQAKSGAGTSVINGQEAQLGTFPYLAFVESNESACSGTVVSSNVILTAAHCVLNKDFSVLHNPDVFTVVTGNVDYESASRTISTVSRVAVNPNFAYLTPSDVPVRGDVAVLELSQPVSAPPVRFAKTTTWGAGTPVVMVGWGLTSPSGESPETLHYGEAVAQSPSFCSSEYIGFESAWDLCALDYPYEEYTTCHGDSGGPLLMIAPGTTNQVLEIGVASLVKEECSPEKAAAFVRTDSIASWLQQKINEYAPPPPPPPTTSQPTPQPTSSKPQLTTPAATETLPALSESVARSYTLRSLAEAFRGIFRRRHGYRVSCTRVGSAMRKCGISFWVGERDYWGTVTIYYTFEGGRLVWSDRYTVKEVNNWCYYYSGHPKTCRMTTYRS